MSAIIRVLDTEIAKYEALVKNLKASRNAIASAESSPNGTTPAKRRGRPPKNGGAAKIAKKSAAKSSTGRKRGRPRKNAAPSPAGSSTAGSNT